MFGLSLFVLLLWLFHDYMDLESLPIFEETNYKEREQFLSFIRKEIVIVFLLLIIHLWTQ